MVLGCFLAMETNKFEMITLFFCGMGSFSHNYHICMERQKLLLYIGRLTQTDLEIMISRLPLMCNISAAGP